MKPGTRIKRRLRMQPPERAGNIKVLKEHWLECAKVLLIEQGYPDLSVQKMADRLGVSRGSFRYYFGTVEGLYEELISAWESSNHLLPERPDALEHSEVQSILKALCRPLGAPSHFDPQFELAVREWARLSPPIFERVRRKDNQRLAILHAMLRSFGHSSQHASMLAQLVYTLKIGWLATDFGDRSAAVQRKAELLLSEVIRPPILSSPPSGFACAQDATPTTTAQEP